MQRPEVRFQMSDVRARKPETFHLPDRGGKADISQSRLRIPACAPWSKTLPSIPGFPLNKFSNQEAIKVTLKLMKNMKLFLLELPWKTTPSDSWIPGF